MANTQAIAPDERSAKLHIPSPDFQSGHDSSPHEDSVLVLADRTSLLNSRGLRGRGSSSVRAAMMSQAQQTHGNRAVQRALNTYRPTDGMELPSNFRRPRGGIISPGTGENDGGIHGVTNEVLTNEVLRPGGGLHEPHLVTGPGRPSHDDGGITIGWDLL